MGLLFSMCKYFHDSDGDSDENGMGVYNDIPPSEYTPPKQFQKNGKYYVVLNKQSFTEI